MMHERLKKPSKVERFVYPYIKPINSQRKKYWFAFESEIEENFPPDVVSDLLGVGAAKQERFLNAVGAQVFQGVIDEGPVQQRQQHLQFRPVKPWICSTAPTERRN